MMRFFAVLFAGVCSQLALANREIQAAPELAKGLDAGLVTEISEPVVAAAEEELFVGGKGAKKMLHYTLFPVPSPNVMAGFFAFLLWIGIFLVGFCALFSVQTPVKFVEKGLAMNKEY